MTIKKWPKSERPREKLLQLGPDSMTNAELIALFIGSGINGRDAVQIARDAFNRFKSLRGLMHASKEEFMSVPGLGEARYVLFRAAMELSKRELCERVEHQDTMMHPDLVRRYLKSHFRGLQKEVFAVMFLDTRNRVLKFEKMFFGTIDGAAVYPREVVKRCLKYNAAAVILAHNHPSGVSEPSQSDILITQKLKSALKLIDVRVLDHCIIGDSEVQSMAELGHC